MEQRRDVAEHVGWQREQLVSRKIPCFVMKREAASTSGRRDGLLGVNRSNPIECDRFGNESTFYVMCPSMLSVKQKRESCLKRTRDERDDLDQHTE